MKPMPNLTQQDAAELSTRQEAALERLLLGERPGDVARALEIDRVTLWRWTRRPAFRGRLDAAQQQALDAARVRLVGVVERAADVVAEAVQGGDVKVSLSVLRGLKLLGHDARAVEESSVRAQWSAFFAKASQAIDAGDAAEG